MRSQPFAAFVRLSATVLLTASLAPPPSATSAEPAAKKASRTDRYSDPLPKGAILRLGTVRFAQPNPSNLLFSPDGKYLISAGGGKRIRLWDPDTGKELRSLEGHSNGVRWMSLSADGKLLASCDNDKEVILWELETGKVRRRFQCPGWEIHFLSLSPNGKALAASALNTLRLWDTGTGEQTLSLPGPDRRVRAEAVAFTPDSKQFASANRLIHDIHLLDAATGKRIRTFHGHTGRVYQLIFTLDGSTLFSCSFDRTIRSWDVATGKEKQRYGDEKQTVGCFALAPDGKTLTYSTGALVHIWDLAANKERGAPHEAKAWITPDIAYSPDSKKVAVGGETIAIYETATGKRLNPALESESPLHQIKYALGGKLLLVCRWHDKTIDLWDTAKWRKTRTLHPKTDAYFSEMIVSPNGKNLMTAEGDSLQGKRKSMICTWDLQTGKRLKEFPLKDDAWFDSLSYSADGKTLRYHTGNRQSRVFVFRDAATGAELEQLPVSARLPEGRFVLPECKPVLTPDGRVLVWSFVNNTTVGLWDAKTGHLFRTFGDRLSGVYFPPIFSPDGRTIAAAGSLGKGGTVPIQPDLVLWETATGKERLQIVPADGQVKYMVFSPDGRLLATAGQWGTIHVWDLWTGKEVGRFTGHRGSVNTLSFAPDGKTLASGGADHTILIWDVSGLTPAPKPAAETRSREQLVRLWESLADADAARAYKVIAELVQHPDQTESLFKDKIALLKKGDTQRMIRLIADLDNDDFQKRETASKELATFGRAAERSLKEALQPKPSAELKRRIQELLDKLDPKNVNPAQLRLLRAIEVLERLGTVQARQLLRKLVEATSDPDTAREAQAALQRLATRAP